MEQVLVDKFMKSLQTQEKGTSRTTFRVDKVDLDTLTDLLTKAYSFQVRKRNGECEITPDLGKKINASANWLISGQKPGLLLFGSVGSGKTTLARAMVQVVNYLYYAVWSMDRKEVAEVSATKLTKLLTSGEKDGEEMFERYKTKEMLFIDDLGLEPAMVKNFGNEILPIVELLYFRHDRMLFTICTSNLDMNDFEQKYGKRIASRFYEMFNRIGFTGDDYRKR